jgi:carboxyl-terminal processing protease
MVRISRRVWVPVATALAVVVVFLGGAAVGSRLPVFDSLSGTDGSASAPDFALVRDAWSIIDRVYVDRAALQSKPLTYGAIGGMVNALGDTGHSSFLSPQMLRQEQSFIQGQYAGIGVEIQIKDGRVTVVAPLDGSPAARAGLHAGEEILKVDGSSLTNLTLQEAVQRLAGRVGTSVTLTIFDPKSQSTFQVTLKRAEIRVSNVSWQPVPGYPFADLRVAAFSQDVTKAVTAALKQIEAEKYAGVVLDLRNDPGGELAEAIGVASQFLESGNVLLEKNAAGTIRPDPVQPGGVATAIPLVVLVNGGTASAAEIVAGALQDHKRATLVGETTFGTGTVLREFRLPDGSVLLLATEEWLTPDGRSFWHKGIAPTIAVAMPAGAELLTPDLLKGMSAKTFAASSDTQLRRAVELLAAKVGPQ